MADIIQFRGQTSQRIPVERVLEAAKLVCIDALVLGYDKDDELYFASSLGDKKELVYLLEAFKHCLLAGEWDGP